MSGEPLTDDDSAQIPKEIPREWSPRVANTLTKDPNFIKAGFYIGRFITTAVETKKEQTITEALKCNLEFTSE
jgi:hypothetical protein